MLDSWAYEAGVTLSFVRPAEPNASAHIESWRLEYNTARTCSSLGNTTPGEYAAGLLNRAEERVSLTPDSKAGRY